MERTTILMVEDEPEIVKLMEIYFRNEGFELLRAANGEEALQLLEKHKVDLIVMDVMMPKMDGFTACVKIREKHVLPIIMLSAKGQDIDKISGLSLGADDYVTKPFSPLELIARIKSQLRRFRTFGGAVQAEADVIRVDDVAIHLASHKVTVGGREVKLTPREFALLRLLAVNRGTVLTMERIYEEVRNDPFMDSKNSVMVHIRKLREKIEANPKDPRIIKTVWGVGYKMEAE